MHVCQEAEQKSTSALAKSDLNRPRTGPTLELRIRNPLEAQIQPIFTMYIFHSPLSAFLQSPFQIASEYESIQSHTTKPTHILRYSTEKILNCAVKHLFYTFILPFSISVCSCFFCTPSAPFSFHPLHSDVDVSSQLAIWTERNNTKQQKNIFMRATFLRNSFPAEKTREILATVQLEIFCLPSCYLKRKD